MADIPLTDGTMGIIFSLKDKAVRSANAAAILQRQADADRLNLEEYLNQVGEKLGINIKEFDVMLAEKVLRPITVKESTTLE